MSTTDNPRVALHVNRARAAALVVRAEKKLARLGTKTATTRRPPVARGVETATRRRGAPDRLTRGLSAEEIENDTAFIRSPGNLWKRNRRARPYGGTGVNLPSGRSFVFRPGKGIRPS